jgi:hypothetical protein
MDFAQFRLQRLNRLEQVHPTHSQGAGDLNISGSLHLDVAANLDIPDEVACQAL